jgi:hypothetical protein
VKRAALILLGGLLVLTVALSASAAQRHANGTRDTKPEVQKAEKCILSALRKEDLTNKYLEEGHISDTVIVNTVLRPATADLLCAIEATNAAEASGEISPAERTAAFADLIDAHVSDVVARNDLIEGELGGRSYQGERELKVADLQKHRALAVLEKVEKAATTPPGGKVVKIEVGLTCGGVVSAPIAVTNPTGTKPVIYVAHFKPHPFCGTNSQYLVDPATGKQLPDNMVIFPPNTTVYADQYECAQHPELDGCAGQGLDSQVFVFGITVTNPRP